MRYKRRVRAVNTAGCFYRFESLDHRRVEGFGDLDYVRLKDADGNVWQGAGERYDDVIRYRFRDGRGRAMTGVADGFGIMLRDHQGMTWRGYVY